MFFYFYTFQVGFKVSDVHMNELSQGHGVGVDNFQRLFHIQPNRCKSVIVAIATIVAALMISHYAHRDELNITYIHTCIHA